MMTFLGAICLALRKAAKSKAKKDWENKQSPVEDRKRLLECILDTITNYSIRRLQIWKY